MTVPYVFTFEEMWEHFLDQADQPTAEDVEEAGCRIGRNAYPALVASLLDKGLLAPEVATVVVPSAWSAVEFPQGALTKNKWRSLFDLAGYTQDGTQATRPKEPLRLWRGAIPKCRRRWAWTDDRELADWFAKRTFNGGQGRVWTAKVPPTRLLAYISQQRPGEAEYVVDTTGLTILAD